MKVLVTILLVTFCGSAQAQSNQQRVRSVKKPTLVTIIRGIWWSVEPAPSAAFQIKDSTIYYPDMFAEYPYTLKGDTLFIHRDDGITSSAILKASKDTLILKSYDVVLIYTKAEPQSP